MNIAPQLFNQTNMTTRLNIMHCLSRAKKMRFAKFETGKLPASLMSIKVVFGITDTLMVDVIENIEKLFNIEITADDEKLIDCSTTICDLAVMVESKIGTQHV